MLKVVLIIVAIPVAVLLFQQTVMRFIRWYWHFSSPMFFGMMFDSRIRRASQPPEKVVSNSGIAPGMQVLDLGCGTGTYTFEAARVAWPDGKVFALDIQREMLDLLRKQWARPENSDLQNIEIVQGSAFELPFPDDYFDAVFIVTALHEIGDRHASLLEAKRVVKPGGYLSVSQWLMYLEYPLRTTMVKAAREAGLELDASLGSFWQYTLRFRKPDGAASAAAETPSGSVTSRGTTGSRSQPQPQK